MYICIHIHTYTCIYIYKYLFDFSLAHCRHTCCVALQCAQRARTARQRWARHAKDALALEVAGTSPSHLPWYKYTRSRLEGKPVIDGRDARATPHKRRLKPAPAAQKVEIKQNWMTVASSGDDSVLPAQLGGSAVAAMAAELVVTRGVDSEQEAAVGDRPEEHFCSAHSESSSWSGKFLAESAVHLCSVVRLRLAARRLFRICSEPTGGICRQRRCMCVCTYVRTHVSIFLRACVW